MQRYTHRDLAKALGVSETTIKSYRAKFPSFLPVAREGKPVRLHPEALDVCRRIRELFADGLSILQTSQALQAEFKEYPRNRRLSTLQTSAVSTAPGESPEPGESALGPRIEALTQAQNQARGRMEQLELEVRNLATMEAASKALIAELLAELRAARANLPQAPGTANLAAANSGLVTDLATGQAHAQPSAQADHFVQTLQQAEAAGHIVMPPAQPASTPPPASPPSTRSEAHPLSAASVAPRASAPAEGIDTAANLADLPKGGAATGAASDTTHDLASGAGPTVLTARKIVTLHGPAGPVASYALGREPKPEPHFPEPPAPTPAFFELPAVIRSDRGDFLGLPGGQSVRRLVEVLTPEGAPPPVWFQESPESWTCAIPLGRAQNRELLFERTTTPRGNLVGLIRRMRINETEATPMQLQEIFRQLRDQLT